MSIVDPTEDVPHDIEAGQVYEDSRSGDFFELIYVDGNVYVAQNDSGGHRLGVREDFEANVAADRYKLREAATSFAETTGDDAKAMEFGAVDNIGKQGARNLRDEGFRTADDIRRASDDELLDVSWIGESGVEALRKEVQ